MPPPSSAQRNATRLPRRPMSRVTRPAAGLPRRARSAAGSMPCATALRTSWIRAPRIMFSTRGSSRIAPPVAAKCTSLPCACATSRAVRSNAATIAAAGASRSFAAASSACAISRSAWSSAWASATAPRSERNCRPVSAIASWRTSSSALSARLRSAGSSTAAARGVGASGRLSAATRAASASTRRNSASICGFGVAPGRSRSGSNASSMACASSAISFCRTTRAAPLSVCARRNRRGTSSGAGADSRRSTSRPISSARSRASMRK